MLRDSPLDVVLLATDLDVARDFYSNKLGLALIDGSGQRLTFFVNGVRHDDEHTFDSLLAALEKARSQSASELRTSRAPTHRNSSSPISARSTWRQEP